MLAEFMRKHGLHKEFIQTAQQWYIPLAEQISMHQKSAEAPLFIGINGCQGSGKSTLSAFLQDYLQAEHQLSVVNLSLDDFYLSKSERLALSIKIHPLFATRGVPGTHNTELMQSVLTQLKTKTLPINIPRFDKASDNPFPKEDWPSVTSSVDVVLFEGWCWGVEPQTSNQLSTPINQLEQEEDDLAIWRNYANRQLNDKYLPLYEYMNMWVMLKAPDFSNVYKWRLEQEQKLQKNKQNTSTNGIMNEQQISRFIQYYQRLTEHSIATLADKCDVVFELDKARNITQQLNKAKA